MTVTDLTVSPAPFRGARSSSATRQDRHAATSMASRRPVAVKHFLFGAAALVLSLVIAFVFSALSLVIRATDNITERRLLDSATTMSIAVDAELSKYLGVLQALTAGWDATAGNIEALYQQAALIHRQHPPLASLALVDPNGRQVFNALRPLGEPLPPVASADVLAEVRRTGAPAISNLFFSALASTPVVALGVPVVGNGDIAFVLTATLHPYTFQQLLESVFRIPDGITAIVDRRDILIARRHSPHTSVGQPASPSFVAATEKGDEGLFDGKTREGLPTVAAFRRSSLSGWKVVTAIPAEGIEPELRRLTWLLGIGGIALVGLVMIVTAWFSNHLSSAIGGLAIAAGDLGQGRRPRILPAGLIEIDHVGSAMSEAARQREHADAALIVAREEAEQANHSKGEFLAHMSHELRTPLNAIIGFADLIEGRALGDAPVERYLEYARDIRISGQHLLEIINDILHMARLDTTQIELKEAPVSISAVVGTSLIVLQPLAGERGVELENHAAKSDRVVMADERVLRQVLINLLSNAVKFTPRGGRITVSTAMTGDGELAIAVADTGSGIDPELLPMLFTPFTRTRPTISAPGAGTGLGLAISKRLMDLHRGRIDIVSTPGVGTTATVYLPASRIVPGATCDKS
jgi:signal transduction histidine kinase